MNSMKQFLLLVLLAGAVSQVNSAVIPLWHWSDGHIRYFEDRGLLQMPFRSVKPYSFVKLRALAAAIDSSVLNHCEPALRGRLADYAAGINSSGGSFAINGGISFDDEAGGWVNPVLAYGFTPHLSLYSSFRIMNARSGYGGKEYGGVNAYNDQGILMYEKGGIVAKIGRDYLRLGPGYAGQLLLSDASPAFDQYRVDLTRDRVRYTFWGLALNKRAGMNRYVNGHRLTLRLPGKVEIGLNEMIIYGGPRAHWQLTYMNPVLFYHGHALNTGDEINTMLSVDADWQASPELRCWTELLVDDFQTERSKSSELEPAELGITAGAVWSGLPDFPGGSIMLEYSQVTHRTYNAPVNDWEKYLHRDITPGSTHQRQHTHIHMQVQLIEKGYRHKRQRTGKQFPDTTEPGKRSRTQPVHQQLVDGKNCRTGDNHNHQYFMDTTVHRHQKKNNEQQTHQPVQHNCRRL